MEIAQTQVSESSGVEPLAREYFDVVFGARLKSSWGFPVRDGSYPDTLAVEHLRVDSASHAAGLHFPASTDSVELRK
jgi:hypothetical protein